MAVVVGDLPSGRRPRRDAAVDQARWRRLPAPARTPPPAGGARCTSAACRTGCPTHGCAPPASGGWPGPVPAPRAWRLADHGPLGQHLPAGLVVVAGVKVHHRPGGQHTEHGDRVQGRCQQPVVTAVSRSRDRTQRDAAGVGDDRALQALLAAVHRTGPGDLATAGRLGDAPIHRQLLQFQTEHPVVGGQHAQT